ncbi:hypothetical protein [Cryobacterium sp. PH31-L1]|nr:hypothetical protein [Cryobacterium sp. PH31-L1]MDJ0375896.1 hypothetical protein [Cryobacterium sp. PH31-L1]
MRFLPKDELEPDKGGRKPPSMNRIAIWVIVGGVGVYFLGSGIVGLLSK